MERTSRKKQAAEAAASKKNVVFFHPDLGIGGAERLVIDAAVGLQDLGHKITIFTSHCDKTHCFDEARDGTLDVRARGNTILPATIVGRFKILCSILRQLHLIFIITYTGELAQLKPSVFILDQLSAGIPFLRWFWEDTKIIFYCHFPDFLLAQHRKNWYRQVWRLGFDWLEDWSIRSADRIVVNSGFTKGVVGSIWPGLGGEQGVGVIYPCVDTNQKQYLNDTVINEKIEQKMWKGRNILLSINRFERKKNVNLAIKAFAGLSARERAGVSLVIAGGYDTKVPENAACHKELEASAASLNLKFATAKNIVSAQAVPDDVEILFLLSVPEQLKTSLLHAAKLLIYTPSDEHFGIVPLEAMLAGVPVLAAKSGGPLETVLDGQTGWLRDADRVKEWTDVIRGVLYNIPEAQLKQIGSSGQKRVEQEFSKAKMARRFDEELEAVIKRPRPQATELGDVALALVMYFAAAGAIIFVVWEGLRPAVPGVANKKLDIALGSGIVAVALFVFGAVTWKLMQNESAFR
ncbi:MAG: hypothetical protein Q9217_003615 [Psora testacea]